MNKKKAITPHNHSDVLSAMAKQLDLTEAQYELAEKRYKALGTWLERPESAVSEFAPYIHPQGSMLLGTVTRPIDDTDEFDIDLVSRVNLSKHDISQADLKRLIGDEVKSYAKAHGIKAPVDEGKRCWTLLYADETSFHMDILPAIPSASRSAGYDISPSTTEFSGNYSDTIIDITDNTHPHYENLSSDWLSSNPLGYAQWFQKRMAVEMSKRKAAFLNAEGIYAKVDDVPDYKVKTPLQQVIQLLKRHRDIMFEGDEDKPISVIITTLAAHAYNNESDLALALRNILGKIDQIPQQKSGQWYIPNPVNPDENFADKWASNPRKVENFMNWAEKARSDAMEYLAGSSFDALPISFAESFGEDSISKAAKGAFDMDVSFTRSSVNLLGATTVAPSLDTAVSTAKATGTVSKPWLGG